MSILIDVDPVLSNGSNTNTTLYSAPVVPTNGATIVVGIIMGLTASVGINLGNNIQAVALGRMTKEGLEKKPKLWWMGTLMFAFASIINFAAFPFAPAAVLAPLESIQFVTNLIFARFVNKRKITTPMLIGSGMTIGGTVLTILFGPNKLAEFPNADEVAALWGNGMWIGYLVLANALAFALLFAHHVYDAAKLSGNPRPYSALVLPVTFAVSTAVFGSFCVVSAKTMGELVTIFLGGQFGPVLSHWFFYVTLVVLLVCMSVWLGRLNAALRLYDPIFIIPLVQANYIIFSILSGGFFFQEFALMTTAIAWAMFVSGIVIMIAGLAFLSPVNCFSSSSAPVDEYTPLVDSNDTAHFLLTYKPEYGGQEYAPMGGLLSSTGRGLLCCCGPPPNQSPSKHLGTAGTTHISTKI